MDDFDDPIDDLLSEGDSFFEDPKLLAKKSTPKKSAKAVADIFGLGLDTETKPAPAQLKETTIKKDDWLGLNVDKKEKEIVKEKQADIKTKKPENKLSFESDDVNNLLGLSAPEPKTAAAKKSSILSDILGETKQDDKTFSFEDILQSSSIRKKEPIPIPTPAVTETKTVPPAQTQSEFTPTIARDSRRGRRNSPNLIDPLGIFESQKKETKPEQIVKNDPISKREDSRKSDSLTKSSIFEPAETKQAESFSGISKPIQTSSGLPNWLGGSSQEKPKQEKQIPEPILEVKKVVQEPVTILQPVHVTSDSNVSDKQPSIPDHMLESILTQQKISSSHIELQNASLALQQQESQLMIAVQLKKYEDSLAEMQRKQQEIILKQDVQFNSLLERQFAKQQIMENNMRLQQERINNHIQLLLSQPSGSAGVVGDNTSVEQQRKSDYIKATFEENRQFYDDIVNSLKQKHQEEIFLLEESYKKQLTFLENSLESTEKRLKAEIENVNQFFTEKIDELSKEKGDLINKYEEKIKQINEQNLSEIETIKENCKITITDVRNEYKQMMDDMSNSKTKEQETIAGAEIITRKIDESLEVLQGSTKAINEIQNKFNYDHQILNEVKAETLTAREMEIKMMQTSLEKQRAASDGERAQLLALVRTLETRVAEQTQSTREERWALQQATATLSARAQALDRESEFVRKNLEREREQVKVLKETLLAEHEKIILQLNEEKLAVVAERSRLETSAKLNQNFDSSKAKAEVEAALKIAKEATDLTDRERENLCKQQCEVEILKRNLQDRETKLLAKEHELDKMFKVSDLKYRDGEKALNEAKITEHKYNERLKDIQKQLVSLAAREKKLTEEKIALSKDRLTLHNQLKDNKKCGLCEADNYKTDYNSDASKFVEHNVPVWGTDAEILRLKYDLENDNVVSKEHSVVENDSET